MCFFQLEREKSRGIIVYVANEIHATQLEIDSEFMEYMLIKVEAPGRNNIIFGTFYRSPSSTADNNNELTRLISCINNKFKDQLIFVGDRKSVV